MRYIKSVHLENFQGYKNETITLEPGLNILLGSSDSGKSAILRAISFVLHNAPRNATMIHHGEEQMSVTIEFSDGVKVTRVKGAEVNAYKTNQKDKNGKIIELDKIDKAVPEEIKKLLNYPPEDDFNGFISYADQFSKMFLVDLSPTDLPRSLSNLTGIEILEESAKQLMQSYKAVEKQTKVDEKNYDKLLQELESYSFIDEYEDRVFNLSFKIKKLESLQEELEALEQIYNEADFETEIESIDVLDALLEKIESALKKVKKAQDKISEYAKLQIFNLFTENNAPQTDPEKYTSLLSKIDNVIKKIHDARTKAATYNECVSINNGYLTLKTQAMKVSEEYKTLQTQLAESEASLSEFKQFLVDKNIVCKLCGSVLK